MPIERSVVIMKMKQAFAEGLSASAFIKEMQAEGLGYRRTTMLADWRSELSIEGKKGLLRYVRKDRVPTAAVQAKDWREMSAEFMYKVRVLSRTRPTEPIESNFVNIMQDRPLTPAEIEGLTWELIGEQSPNKISEVVGVTAWSAIQRVV